MPLNGAAPGSSTADVSFLSGDFLAMTFRSLLATAAVVLSIAPRLAHADTKFGYVDLQRALTEVEEGRAAKARLQSMLDQKQKDLDKEQEVLRKEKDVLDKQASAMSEETRVAKQTELQK